MKTVQKKSREKRRQKDKTRINLRDKNFMRQKSIGKSVQDLSDNLREETTKQDKETRQQDKTINKWKTSKMDKAICVLNSSGKQNNWVMWEAKYKAQACMKGWL